MALARHELGPDAMLVQSRRAAPEARYLGDYEVVFAAAPEDQSAPVEESRTPEPRTVRLATTAGPLAAGPTRPTSNDAGVNELSRDLADVKRQLASLTAALGNAPTAPGLRVTNPEIQRITAALAAGELSPDLIDRVAADISRGMPALEALTRYIRIDSSIGIPATERRIVALVGPPGCGKTTTLVKLAARYGLQARTAAQIVSMDMFRIAAADQLRSYAGILGITFDCVETSFALAQKLEFLRQKDLVLIDTPGLSEQELSEIADLAIFLANHPEIDTHLVLPASMRGADLARTIDRYQIFGPRKLIFTKVDETRSYGPLINESHRKRTPISFLTAGQQIPEDLAPADAATLAGLLLDGPQDACAVAAEQGGVS